jgi:xanthine phosphoribosyltransferase
VDSLIDRIRTDAVYLGDGLLRVDSFLNHQVDTILLTEVGEWLAQRLTPGGDAVISKVVTAETSGIVPGLVVAQAFGVPLLFARKKRPRTLTGEVYVAQARSHTKEEAVVLQIAADYLRPEDRVLIIDDFLGTGATLAALIDLVEQSGAQLDGIGVVIEKRYEGGRARLGELVVPVVAAAVVDLEGEALLVSAADLEAGDRG